MDIPRLKMAPSEEEGLQVERSPLPVQALGAMGQGQPMPTLPTEGLASEVAAAIPALRLHRRQEVFMGQRQEVPVPVIAALPAMAALPEVRAIVALQVAPVVRSAAAAAVAAAPSAAAVAAAVPAQVAPSAAVAAVALVVEDRLLKQNIYTLNI